MLCHVCTCTPVQLGKRRHDRLCPHPMVEVNGYFYCNVHDRSPQ